MQLVQATCERESQSPTDPISKVTKSASLAWGIVAIQAQEIAQLKTGVFKD